MCDKFLYRLCDSALNCLTVLEICPVLRVIYRGLDLLGKIVNAHFEIVNQSSDGFLRHIPLE